MTTADYLESLQDDLDRTIAALDLEEGTNFTDIADMAENGDISTGGGGADQDTETLVQIDENSTFTKFKFPGEEIEVESGFDKNALNGKEFLIAPLEEYDPDGEMPSFHFSFDGNNLNCMIYMPEIGAFSWDLPWIYNSESNKYIIDADEWGDENLEYVDTVIDFGVPAEFSTYDLQGFPPIKMYYIDE